MGSQRAARETTCPRGRHRLPARIGPAWPLPTAPIPLLAPLLATSPLQRPAMSSKTANAVGLVALAGTVVLAAAATYKYAYKHEPLPKVVSARRAALGRCSQLVS